MELEHSGEILDLDDEDVEKVRLDTATVDLKEASQLSCTANSNCCSINAYKPHLVSVNHSHIYNSLWLILEWQGNQDVLLVPSNV